MCLTAFKAVMWMGQGGDQEEENNNERTLIRRPPPTDPDKWNALPEVPTRTEMGYLHLSFEYHRGALRVRVWQISDLLLPPPPISMIHSLFVRGYFLPDKVKKTLRRTEEVLVEPVDKDGVATPSSGVQHIFTPSSFKFQMPLMYTGLTPTIIRSRSLQLEVCMTQKGTHKVFLMAMVHMPLRTALRRPIREKYPLIPCLNITTPSSMRVYSATLLPHLPAGINSGGSPGGVTDQDKQMGNGMVAAGKETDLEDDVSLSGDDFLRSHLSLCLDEDSEDDSLARSGSSIMATSQTSNGGAGSGASSSSSNTLNNPSSGDELDDSRYDDAGGDEDYDDDDDDDDDEDRSDWGEDRTRNTPLNGGLCDLSDASASKKRIIPNEIVQEEEEEEESDMTLDKIREASGTPESFQEAMSDDALSSSRASTPRPTTNGFQGSDSSEDNADTDPDMAESTVRKKVIPAAHLDIATGDEERDCIQKEESSSSAAPSPGSCVSVPAHKDKSVISSRNQSSPADSSSKSTNPADVKPPSERVKSAALAPPGAHPPSSSSLSPLADSGFSPASRPETPCWDFYDFSEDLLPEGDLLESGNQHLEESLAQLRQHGIGSLQNLSLEPILPMVLVDDFDTLTVDEDRADDERVVAKGEDKADVGKVVAVDDERVNVEKVVAVDDERVDDKKVVTVVEGKGLEVGDEHDLAVENKKVLAVDIERVAVDDKKTVSV